MKKKIINNSLSSANAHSIGKVRRYNEDALYAFESEIVRMDHKETIGLYIIADGMGGHISGDRASACAVNAFVQFFFESIYSEIISDEEGSKSIPDLLKTGVSQANHAVIEKVHGGGTTFTAVLIWNEKLYLAHVGDSRIYLFDKKFTSERLTSDHSFVHMLVRMGEITEEEALTHPRRSVLLRSLGFDDDVEVDTDEREFAAGETLLLCCDGLWSVVPESGIIEKIREKSDLLETAENLIEAANDLGGPDNISCILVQRR